jgi:hydroxyethylthiazole kinase-like uncharacterized protein yjeF
MSSLLRAEAIRAIEQRELAAGANLMERAGRAAANAARAMLQSAAQHPARVLVLAGPGNNGGDAFEAAVHLRAWGYEVHVCFAADAQQLPPDAAAAYAKWLAAGSDCSPTLPALEHLDLVIDGLFGIGLARPIESPYSGWIDALNAARLPVLAIDVPSGLNADTGDVLGRCVRAARTISFIADKPGLHTLDGPDHAGSIELATLDLRFATPPDAGHLAGPADFSAFLAPRPKNSHKGSFGSLGVLGGASGMGGAALLAGRAALRLGAGKVFVGMLDEGGPAVDQLQPELMLRVAAEMDYSQCSALVIGPGLGTSVAARAVVVAGIGSAVPLLLDADALNLLGGDAALAHAIAQRAAPTLLTPHPQEAARLLGCTTFEVQADRIAAACKLAQRFRAHVVLKGAGSVIATPPVPPAAPRWWINPTGNPGMASAGMGDALSGIAGAFLAQFASKRPAETLGTGHSQADAALQSLVGAVFLHGAAADFLVAQGTGPVGLTASDIIDTARDLWNRWSAAAHPKNNQ